MIKGNSSSKRKKTSKIVSTLEIYQVYHRTVRHRAFPACMTVSLSVGGNYITGENTGKEFAIDQLLSAHTQVILDTNERNNELRRLKKEQKVLK